MADGLKHLSDALAGAVETGGASMVRVEGRRRMPASGIVWSADGVIVTAHHVVQRDEELTIGLPDGETTGATLVGRDPTTDLAVLRAEAKGLKPAAWAEAEGLRVGQLVLALGRPGRSARATLGVISALGDSWRTSGGGLIDRYLETDVTMYPGFSGGPLMVAGGEVAALNTSALLRGASVAVPAVTVRRVVEALLTHGRVKRGYLGVGGQPARLPEGLAKELGQEVGLLLVSVEPDSPAEGAGLLLGDVLVSFAGEPLNHMDDLLAQLGGDRVGQMAAVRLVRGGSLMEVSVTVGERE